MFQTKLNLSNNKFEQTSGSTLNLGGSLSVNSFSATTFTISQQPQQGTSGDTILVRANDGSIREISQSGITGGGGTTLTFNNGLTEAGGTVSLGGILTGNTIVNTGYYSIGFGSSLTSTGENSFATGYFSCAIGRTSTAQGFNTKAIGNYSHSEGSTTIANGYSSHAEGANTIANGNYSHSQGCFTSANGLASHAGGIGLSDGRDIIADAQSSFNHSLNNASQIIGHGALAIESAILGGRNHNIESGNTRAAIIGGNTIKLTGTTYIDTTAVSRFAIISNPDNGISTNNILVRDNTTGIIKQIPQSGITGGGGGTTELNILDISGATSATISVNNHVIIVDTTSSSQTITLPSAPQNGLNFKIKDNGNALTNEITINGNTKNIDGESTALINTNYGALELIYQQSVDAWYILSFNN